MIALLISMVLDPAGKVDRWSEFQEEVRNNEERRRRTLGEHRGLCICPNCPTYTDCAKQKRELFFCSIGSARSAYIKEEKWCICESCPVTQLEGLTNIYYCIKGNENQQRNGP